MSTSRNNSLSDPILLGISFAAALFAGLVATFFLHAIGSWLKGGFISSLVLPIGVMLSMIMVGVILGRMSDPAPIKYVLIVVLVLMVEVSWYWWDYRDFKAKVAQLPVAAQTAGPSTAADMFLAEETGSPGFWGYLKWSASRGATFEDSKIAAGGRAAVVNWGKRLISLFWSLVWAIVGLAQG